MRLYLNYNVDIYFALNIFNRNGARTCAGCKSLIQSV